MIISDYRDWSSWENYSFCRRRRTGFVEEWRRLSLQFDLHYQLIMFSLSRLVVVVVVIRSSKDVFNFHSQITLREAAMTSGKVDSNWEYNYV